MEKPSQAIKQDRLLELFDNGGFGQIQEAVQNFLDRNMGDKQKSGLYALLYPNVKRQILLSVGSIRVAGVKRSLTPEEHKDIESLVLQISDVSGLSSDELSSSSSEPVITGRIFQFHDGQ